MRQVGIKLEDDFYREIKMEVARQLKTVKQYISEVIEADLKTKKRKRVNTAVQSIVVYSRERKSFAYQL